MRRITGSRLMTLGAAVLGAGVVVTVSWWVYGMQDNPKESFWQTPGWVGTGLMAAAALCLLVGLFRRDAKPDPLSQAKDQSVAQSISAGDIDSDGDVNISQRSDNR